MFTQFNTVSEVKQAFKTYAFKLHPDRGGSHDAFVEMQALYLKKLASLDGQESTGFDNKKHTYKYNENVESEVMDKITEILNLNLEGIEIELCGTWLWISGKTREYKDKLKGLKLRWHSKRLMWYYHTATYRRRMSKMSMGDIRFAYGSQTYARGEEKQLQIA